MAYDDIQIHSSQGGVTPRIAYFGMDSGEAFTKGDVLSCVSEDGQVQEAVATGVTAPGLTGIAMEGSVGPAGIARLNPKTGTTYAENDAIGG